MSKEIENKLQELFILVLKELIDQGKVEYGNVDETLHEIDDALDIVRILLMEDDSEEDAMIEEAWSQVLAERA